MANFINNGKRKRLSGSPNHPYNQPFCISRSEQANKGCKDKQPGLANLPAARCESRRAIEATQRKPSENQPDNTSHQVEYYDQDANGSWEVKTGTAVIPLLPVRSK